MEHTEDWFEVAKAIAAPRASEPEKIKVEEVFAEVARNLTARISELEKRLAHQEYRARLYQEYYEKHQDIVRMVVEVLHKHAPTILTKGDGGGAHS